MLTKEDAGIVNGLNRHSTLTARSIFELNNWLDALDNHPQAIQDAKIMAAFEKNRDMTPAQRVALYEATLAVVEHLKQTRGAV